MLIHNKIVSQKNNSKYLKVFFLFHIASIVLYVKYVGGKYISIGNNVKMDFMVFVLTHFYVLSPSFNKQTFRNNCL